MSRINWLINLFCLDIPGKYGGGICCSVSVFFQIHDNYKLAGADSGTFRQPSAVLQVWCFWGISDWTVSTTWWSSVLTSWSNLGTMVNFMCGWLLREGCFSGCQVYWTATVIKKYFLRLQYFLDQHLRVEFPINTQMRHVPPRTLSAHISKQSKL